MNKKQLIIALGVGILFLGVLTYNQGKMNQLTEEKMALENEVNTLTSEIQNMTQQMTELQANTDEYLKTFELVNDQIAFITNQNDYRLQMIQTQLVLINDSETLKNALVADDHYLVFHKMDDMGTPYIGGFKTYVSDQTPEELLETILNFLRYQSFDGVDLTLESIEDVDGRKLATVNLSENPRSNKRWDSLYFQGSFGGSVTSYELIDNLLQPHLKNWCIDGVVFLYEGQPIDNFEHAYELSTTHWRD